MKMKSRVLSLIIALALPVVAMGGTTVAVKLSPETWAAAQGTVQPHRVLDYDTFVWLELDELDLDLLDAAGHAYHLVRDPFTLTLGGNRFDPSLGVPESPEGWGPTRATGPALHLVQLVGPTRAEWLEHLERANLEIVQYIHPQ